ncbi:cytochrome b [Achromobacter sp. K91]|uniref:cytochrome b n=1 Tax=Achromobacter sp. K91 TaxID=2292262 RepID=UPI000E6636D2|nr:cytochrome b [Achromobacter sp. K91]RII99549.1 cytochrome b [Achromobacter sp. K91]
MEPHNSPTASAVDSSPTRYDLLTLVLHWLTAILVLALFVLAEVWDDLPRGTPTRKLLQSLHISFGILFAAILTARIVWRVAAGRRLPRVDSGLRGLAGSCVHILLYGLMAAQVVLGFQLRWAQSEPFSFFGLFDVPTLIDIGHDQASAISDLHYKVAWAIVILAGCHAMAGLVHHYWWKDGVLRRMLPARRDD